MSDPVTNAEVEDVLSSIRRLVSEDKRPVRAPNTPPKTDRLVLTPALRVTEDAGKSDDNLSGSEREPEETRRENDDLFLSSLVTDDEPLDVFGDREPAQADDSALPQDDDIPDVEDIDADSYDDDHLFDDPANDYSSDPYNFDDDADDDGEGDDAHLSRFTADVQNEAEEVGDSSKGEDKHDLSETAILMPQDKIEQNLSPEARSDDPSADADHNESAEAIENASTPADQTKTIALTAKLAALESAIGQISDKWEPEEAGENEYAGTEPEAMEWEDDLPDPAAIARMSRAAPAERLEPEPEQPPEAPAEPVRDTGPQSHQAEQPQGKPEPEENTGFDYAEDEQLIDEDALRDLVAEIVRAELQGALGERITRNVRKLVRREIHRALTAQELE